MYGVRNSYGNFLLLKSLKGMNGPQRKCISASTGGASSPTSAGMPPLVLRTAISHRAKVQLPRVPGPEACADSRVGFRSCTKSCQGAHGARNPGPIDLALPSTTSSLLLAWPFHLFASSTSETVPSQVVQMSDEATA